MIPYVHFLGIPFKLNSTDREEGIDCCATVKEIYDQEGVEFDYDVFRTPDHPDRGKFEKIPNWPKGWRELDIVCTDPEETGHVTHVGVVVSDGSSGYVLSSCKGVGVFAAPSYSVKNVVSVWRKIA
jgi:hypothetical protein